MSSYWMELMEQQNEAGERITVQIERIVYHNEENSYSILRCSDKQARRSVVVVGIVPGIQQGDTITAEGSWVQDKRYGRQFRIRSFCYERPSSLDAIKAYLASGVIRGVGEKLAERIVAHFGTETLDILDADPHRLSEVTGISKKVVDYIEGSWGEQRVVRELIMFLQPHKVSPKMAVRIFKVYGVDSIQKVRDNPYSLAMDIHGIGFLTADSIADRFGFDKESYERIVAGLIYILSKSAEEGHMYYPVPELLEKSADILQVAKERIEQVLRESLKKTKLFVAEVCGEEEGIYLARHYVYEQGIARDIERIKNSPSSMREADATTLLEKILEEDTANIVLSDEQQQAVVNSIHHKVMVLTGGPGTGKTTITNCIIQMFTRRKGKVMLCAPTGRAAKRMTEATQRTAKTIHRLLEYNPKEERFLYSREHQLSCDLLVLDECSMVDSYLMYMLLQAVPSTATVLLVGDIHQLPSVGAGNVLRDIICSEEVKVFELTTIFRQASESRIIRNAHRVNNGEMPEIEHTKNLSDFYFIPAVEPESVAQTVVAYVQQHIPRRFSFRPVRDIQVLSPILRGITGVQALNIALQEALNPQIDAIQRGERRYGLGDKVMQIKNNYDKDVFNGDVGYICYINTKEKECTVTYDDKNVLYAYHELDELMPAYAISIHKSQGSEYPAVVIPITMQHYIMLQRNLLYTAITRGKKLVVLIGDPKALRIAIHNNTIHKRYTRLQQRIQQLL